MNVAVQLLIDTSFGYVCTTSALITLASILSQSALVRKDTDSADKYARLAKLTEDTYWVGLWLGFGIAVFNALTNGAPLRPFPLWLAALAIRYAASMRYLAK